MTLLRSIILFIWFIGQDSAYKFVFFFSSRRRHTRWPRDWSQTCALPISYSPQNPRTMRQSARATLATDPTLSSLIKAPLDANETGPAELGTRYPVLDNVGILRDKNGTTYLLSAKSNVKLPAGMLLMLKNEPGGSSETAEGKTASGTSTDERLPH